MSKNQVVALFESGRHQHRLMEDQVTVSRLRDALDAAVITFELDDDGDIYILDGVDFKLWVIIDEPSKQIQLLTIWHRGTLSPEDVNEFNLTYKVVQFSLDETIVRANYFMTFDGGFDTRHLIIMVRSFAKTCRQVYRETADSRTEDE